MCILALEILQSAYASIQDDGRVGAEHLGVARAGFADARHGRLANALCGNVLDAPALEIFVGRFTARFQDDCCFATAGATASVRLDGAEIPVGAKLLARKGSVLTLGRASYGRLIYLALPGGIRITPVLGSHATDLAASFGGYEGRLVRAGDLLQSVKPDVCMPLSRAFLAPMRRPSVLHFVPDPRIEPEVLTRFIGSEWRVNPQSQRAGTRLIGTPLPAMHHDGVSRGVVPGVIQIPPDGLPILLGVDAQTIGGYPVIGTLVASDLGRLAQWDVSATLRFAPCTVADAQRLAAAEAAEFARILLGIAHSYGIASMR